MAASNPPAYPAFDCRSDGRVVRWRKWVTRFRNHLVAHAIDGDARQTALLLSSGGDDLYDIVDALPAASLQPVEGQTRLDKLISSIEAHFNPQQNVEFQKFIFRQKKQQTENIDDFYNELRELAPTCGFTNVDAEIKTQLIAGCKSSKIREKGLSQPGLSLQDLLTLARTQQLTHSHSKQMAQGAESVNFMKNKRSDGKSKAPKQNQSQPRGSQQQRQNKSSRRCGNCGGPWPHPEGRESCPAFGRECNSCHKMNHYASLCRSSATNQHKEPSKSGKTQWRSKGNHVKHVAEKDDSSDEEGYVFMAQGAGSLPHFDVMVGASKQKINFLADSGASVNLISEATYNEMKPMPKLAKSTAKIFAYGSQPVSVVGQFKSLLHAGDQSCVSSIHVVKGKERPIMSWDTCRELRLLTETVLTNSVKSANEIPSEFPQLFQGLGHLDDRVIKLHIDEKVQPVAQKQRRVPFHVRQQVEAQIKKDEELGVIEKATGPTPWISPIVVVPKKDPGKIRVCVDMRAANTAIKRERHATPTLDELKTMLTGAKVFSKLDLNQGYNQLELAEESRYITTFATHLGLYRYKRLFFGVNSASEIFQETIRQTLADIDGAVNLSDDILIYGCTQEEHNASLRKVLQRLAERGLTLNRDKCEYDKTSLEFLGHVFGADGIKPSPDKIKIITKMQQPKNASEARSFFGMTNFCGSAFVKDYATLTHDLRQLTKKNTPWEWGEKHKNAFNTLKERLKEACTLAFFDPSKPTALYTDASPVGVSAVLAQGDKIIQFGSRALTSVEQRYSQTEREALAIIWACEYFHIFVFGAPFTVLTDHKPLVSIFGNTRGQTSARIERWVLRTQAYQLTVTYRPGHDNPADYLSRHPVDISPSSREEKVAEEYLNYLVTSATPKTMTVEQVADETAKDHTLQAVIKAFVTNAWYTEEEKVDKTVFHTLFNCRTELSLAHEGRILLKGPRIVLPETLHAQAVRLAHTGHQGIVKTAALLREKVWFKGLQSQVEQSVKACHLCQVTTPTTSREPLEMSELPRAVWTEVSADFGHLPNGKQILVVVDEYSRYPLVEVLDSITANSVIPRLNAIFAMMGIPESLKTDNGPPFNGHDFESFATQTGFHHRKITPLWPRANGETERFMRTVKKTLKFAHTQNLNIKQELYRFLLDYRTTPHSSTGIPPATVFFGRSLRNRLPQVVVSSSPEDADIRARDTRAKARMKSYADARVHAKPCTLGVGDAVLVKDTSISRSRTPFQPDPLVITNKKGSMITASRDGASITRNSSFFKRSSCPAVAGPPTAEDLVDAPVITSPPYPVSEVPAPPASPLVTMQPRSPSSPAPLMQTNPGTPRMKLMPQPATGRPQRQTKPPGYLEDYIRK